MTKKPKPASAKGWCVVDPDNTLLTYTCSFHVPEAEQAAIRFAGLDWRKLGYRVVRFTATEVVK